MSPTMRLTSGSVRFACSTVYDVLMIPEWCSCRRSGASLGSVDSSPILGGALLESPATVQYRHAFEVRHPSYFHDEFYQILRAHRCAFVIADSAGTFGYAEEVTTDFVYVRLHGSQALYSSDYTDDELSMWAGQTAGWLATGRDVYVYFDNDAHVHAPYNAIWLETLVGDRLSV